MGAAGSRLGGLVTTASAAGGPKADGADGDRFCGLENFGNTCYANSVLQALYGCSRFRLAVLSYYGSLQPTATQEDTLLTTLGELFTQIATSKKRTSFVAPKRFIQRLRKDNELFRSHMHQDAHEFLNFVLNCCCDLLEQEERAKQMPETAQPGKARQPIRTWVHQLFEGTLTNQTRCLWCEATTSRDETFLDLSLEISPNSTLSSCLRGFSGVETLCAADKFHCDACGSLQEAQKRMLVKHAPPVLALHLKRFKYSEHLGRHKKLGHRVDFPLQLQLTNTVDDAMAGSSVYHLFAVVVHVGSGPNHGHYVCLVKSPSGWLCIDDDVVEAVDEGVLQTFFGSDDAMQPSPSKASPPVAALPGGAAGSPGGAADAVPGGATAPATDGGIPPGSIPAPAPLAPGTPPLGSGGITTGSGSSSDAYILFYEAEAAQGDAGALAEGGSHAAPMET